MAWMSPVVMKVSWAGSHIVSDIVQHMLSLGNPGCHPVAQVYTYLFVCTLTRHTRPCHTCIQSIRETVLKQAEQIPIFNRTIHLSNHLLHLLHQYLPTFLRRALKRQVEHAACEGLMACSRISAILGAVLATGHGLKHKRRRRFGAATVEVERDIERDDNGGGGSAVTEQVAGGAEEAPEDEGRREIGDGLRLGPPHHGPAAGRAAGDEDAVCRLDAHALAGHGLWPGRKGRGARL